MANTVTPNFGIKKPAAGDINWDDEYAQFADLVDSRLMMTGMKNVIINGNLNINQQEVSGTVVLLAGVYGHDRFKAGSSGCTYTFATSANVTTITITAGSLQQVIEGVNLFSGTYVLSWGGTAQGKIDAGAYGSSGITGTATGGTNMTVEFNSGTLSKIQLEPGTVATGFEPRLLSIEHRLAYLYFERLSFSGSVSKPVGAGIYSTTTVIFCPVFFNEKRTDPAVSIGQTGTGVIFNGWTGGTTVNGSSEAIGNAGLNSARLDITTTVRTAGDAAVIFSAGNGAYIDINAEI